MSFLETNDDITLEKIDFEWIKSQTKLKNLRIAQKLLKEDGGCFPELDKEILNKIYELDPAEKKRKDAEKIDPEVRKKEINSVLEWESDVTRKEQETQAKKISKDLTQNVFTTDNGKAKGDGNIDLNDDQRQKLAEVEKNKGNEAIKSQDYKEALQYYNKSINYWSKMSATYCNRALVYLKLKDYKKTVEDCNKALELQPNYTRALHRRGKANVALGNFIKAIPDFQAIMALEPDNSEVNADLKDARAQCSKEDLEKLENDKKGTGKSEGTFKRIQIQEDSESDEDEKPKNPKVENKPVSSDQGKKMDQMIDNALVEEQKKNLKEKLSKLEELKAKGSNSIQNGLYDKAVVDFEQCLNYLNNLKTSFTELTDENLEYTKKKSTYLNNIAFCHMQMDHPQKVVEYASRVIELSNIENEVLVKAIMRRGLAYEKLDKILLAKRDYEAIKAIHPSNIQASEGLNRIHKILQNSDEKKRYEKDVAQEKEAEKAKTQTPTQTQVQQQSKEPQTQTPTTAQSTAKKFNITELEGKKEEANNHFKKKTNEGYESAQKGFSTASEQIETHLKDASLSKEDKDVLNKLYLQILSNRALALFNLNRFEESIKDCDKAISVDPNHTKCLFRRACCNSRIAEEAKTKFPQLVGVNQGVDLEKKQIEFYDKARKDLEYLYKIDNKNEEVYKKVQDLLRILVDLRLKHKRMGVDDKTNETSKVSKENNTKEEKKETTKTNSESKKPDRQSSLPTGMTKELLDKVTNNVVKNVTDTLIQGADLPKTASQFETNCQSFKKATDKLYLYVKKIPIEHLSSLYKKSEIPADLVLNITRSLTTQGAKDDPKYCVELLKAIAEFNKFHIIIGLTTKGERKEISALLEELRKQTQDNVAVDKLKEKYSCSN